MADEKVRYVLDVDDKGSPKLVKFGDTAQKAGKKAEKSFEKAGKAVSDFGEQIPGLSNAMKSLADGPAVAAGAAIAALGVGFGAMIKKQIDFADGMNDLSLRLGISTERLSVLSLYAQQSGTDIESLATAMGKLGVKISEGDKNLKRLGITAGTADEALFQLADRIAGTEDPMLRLKIATDAFGKSGQQMLPLLVQGGDALREMAGSAPIVSAEMAKMADDFNDRMEELKGAWSSFGLSMAETILPALTDILAKTTEIVNKTKELQLGSAAKIVAGAATGNYAGIIKGLYGVATRDTRSEIEKSIGAMAGPGGMGGYRGEDLKALNRGAFGAGADAVKPRAAKEDSRLSAIEDQLYKERIAIANSIEKRRKAESRLTAGMAPSLASSMQGQAGIAGMGATSIYAQQMSEQDRIKAMERYQSFLDETVTRSEAAAAKVEAEIVQIAQSASSVLADSFMQISDGVDAFGESIVNGFASMLARMASELAANAALVGFLSLINPGAAASFAGGLGGLSGLVLGRATGGPLPGSGAVVYNERREEAIIQRGPARVEPVASSGDTFIFQVQNPAQASTLQRELQAERRLGKRGIRR